MADHMYMHKNAKCAIKRKGSELLHGLKVFVLPESDVIEGDKPKIGTIKSLGHDVEDKTLIFLVEGTGINLGFGGWVRFEHMKFIEQEIKWRKND